MFTGGPKAEDKLFSSVPDFEVEADKGDITSEQKVGLVSLMTVKKKV